MSDTQWTIVDESAASGLTAAGFGGYDDLVTRQPGTEVGRGGTTRTTRFELKSGDACFIKVYRYEGRNWRNRFRVDKATAEATNYAILRETVGDVCPEVVAFGARRR